MKAVKCIQNANIVLENGILWDASIIIEGDRIAGFGRTVDTEVPTGAEKIDAKGAYVGPGFIDIHIHHAGDNYSTCFEAEKAAEYCLAHGATTILSSPYYSMDFETFMDAIRCGKEAIKNIKSVKGLYLEGPFVNNKYGANQHKNPWGDTIGPERFKRFVDEAGLDAKVWTVAPERDDLLPFLEYARQVNPDVVFAVGHSEATPMQIRGMRKYRPTLQTHSMNATQRIEVPGGTRGYGPDEYCFKEPDVFCELISDSRGIHVNPELQQLLIHNKGVERVVIITDCAKYDSPNPPELADITDLNFDANGGIAGSRLTMDVACRNIMTHTNCGIAQAFVMASLNPARVLGMDDEIGSVDIGKKADLVFVDDRFNIKQVMQEGEVK